MHLHAIPDLPSICPGDNLAAMITDIVTADGTDVLDGDIFVIAQKIVSKSEDRYVNLSSIIPSKNALKLAKSIHRDPRLVEVILSESIDVVRHAPGVLIVQHRLGYVMANAGIDASNLEPATGESERVLLLPQDPDATCRQLRQQFESNFNRRVGVIINDR